MSSAVVTRGLKNFVQVLLSWDDDDDDGIWPAFGRFLEGGSGGLLLIALTATSLVAMKKSESGKLTPPAWILRPIRTLEKGIQPLAIAADIIV